MGLRFPNRTPQSALSNALPIVLATVLALTCLYSFRAGPLSIASAQTHVSPFTLRTETYFFQNDPKGVLSSRVTTARRSDGATATVETVFPGRPKEHTLRVIRYLDGRVTQLADAIAAKTTWPPLALQEVAASRQWLLSPPRNCVFADYEIFLRNDTVLGHKTAVVSESFTITVWRAFDLGCEVLESR
jgi:hypothetical protein